MQHLLSNRSGQDLVEYCLMAIFVLVTAIAIVPGTAEAIAAIALDIKTFRIIAGVAMVAALAGIILHRKNRED